MFFQKTIIALLLAAASIGSDAMLIKKNKTSTPGQWQYLTTFDERQMNGPPRLNRRFLDLIPELKTGYPVFLNSTKFNKDQDVCVQFDYYVNVPNIARWGLHLRLVDDTTGVARNLWTRYGSTGDVWRTGTVLLNKAERAKHGQYLQWMTETTGGTVSFSDFRFDPTLRVCHTAEHNTDFEDDVLNWDVPEVNQATLVYRYTLDHTSGTEMGKVAVLRHGTKMSPKTQVNKDYKCMTFWYNQITNATIKDPTHFSVNFKGETLFQSKNRVTTVNKWFRATLPLAPRFIANFLTIQVDESDHDINTAVLIDDIQFTTEECPEPISCTFSDSFCDWTTAYYDRPGLRWNLGTGRVEGKRYFFDNVTVPVSQEKTIYTDFTNYVPNNAPVELRSEFLPTSDEYCATLDVMYNIFQMGDTFALVHLVETKDFDDRTNLWQLDSAKAHKASAKEYVKERIEVQIPSSFHPRRIALSAKSSYPTSRMAVQAIKVQKGKCGEHKGEVTPTPASQYVKSNLPRETLVVAEELMKNSKTNIEQILALIKINDPIKDACEKLLKELNLAVQNIEHNL